MKRSQAEISREYGPFPGVDAVHGVTFDGRHVWFASGAKLNAIDPDTGKLVRSIDVAAHARTAFDGRHLFQIAEDRILRIDSETGRVLSTIPAPGGGADSGLAWAEGVLWMGQHRGRKIHQIDPQTGAILRTIESDRFVTGVTWSDGELWHATWEGERSDLRRVDPDTGEVLGSRRPVLLRWRKQREGKSSPPAEMRGCRPAGSCAPRRHSRLRAAYCWN
jgi:glutamine cyclotransferase